eukprot:TRINITY_DN105669_c0_g1_i1.p1 TRINITY_DN105669_c0_g1~~TRINITY_DN105669_c0_g1_i1.p1  ORF type:complete len:288 (-),score=52.91 TRINITY_DN105669_c0_g1_i1:365-1228(-)
MMMEQNRCRDPSGFGFETVRSKAVRNMISHDILYQFPIFADRNPKLIKAITERLQTELYHPDSVILQEGDVGHLTYFLVYGKVEVVKVVSDVETKLAELTAGTVFGEMSLLLNVATKRVATVRALEHCDCRVIHQHTFNKVLEQFPQDKQHFRELAESRRETLAQITHASMPVKIDVRCIARMKVLARRLAETKEAEQQQQEMTLPDKPRPTTPSSEAASGTLRDFWDRSVKSASSTPRRPKHAARAMLRPSSAFRPGMPASLRRPVGSNDHVDRAVCQLLRDAYSG